MKKNHKKVIQYLLGVLLGIAVISFAFWAYKVYFVSGHKKSIAFNKTEYAVGEPVYITATGTGSDWIGIYKESDNPRKVNPIYWYYVDDDTHDSGEPYDIKEQKSNKSRKEAFYLPEGTYKAFLLYENGYYAIDEAKMEVKGEGLPSAPVSLEYFQEQVQSGMADGKVRVEFSDQMSDITRNIVLYWADDKGKLEEYTSLAKFKVEGTVTWHQMYPHTIIPAEATRLLAYGNNEYGDSKEFAEYRLRHNSGYTLDEKSMRGSFNVVSDIHINENGGSQEAAKHFEGALKDIEMFNKDSWGLFVVGDIADTGNANEYDKMWDIARLHGGGLPIYLAVGNHDLVLDEMKGKTVFMENAGVSTIYYEKIIQGYHFLCMGSEKAGNQAYFSEQQLKWLEDTLNSCREENSKKPVFLFVHQPLGNTVAGSLPGQGWDGVSDENDCAEKFRSILKSNPQIIMFNGHTHWDMNSEKTLHYKTEELPFVLNTASVAYLWSSYDIPEGEFLEGSQGYFVRIYEDIVIVLGRDFLVNKFIPSAMFVCDFKE